MRKMLLFNLIAMGILFLSAHFANATTCNPRISNIVFSDRSTREGDLYVHTAQATIDPGCPHDKNDQVAVTVFFNDNYYANNLVEILGSSNFTMRGTRNFQMYADRTLQTTFTLKSRLSSSSVMRDFMNSLMVRVSE